MAYVQEKLIVALSIRIQVFVNNAKMDFTSTGIFKIIQAKDSIKLLIMRILIPSVHLAK